MVTLKRGEIYYINFPYTLDRRYPNGKSKHVLVLQEGEYFKHYDTVVVVLITSVDEGKEYYSTTDVEIPKGTAKFYKTSYILCSQPYTVPKVLFKGRRLFDVISPQILDEVDEALYFGLSMGSQSEDSEHETAANE